MCETDLKRAIVLTTIVALHSVALSAEFAGGTGAPNAPYQIATAEQLVSIGSNAVMMEKHFVLVGDIDLDPNLPGGQVFDGIVLARSSMSPFAGTLDGNGHSILNLTIETNSRFGLIGGIGSEGHVRNLGLVGVRISGAKGGALIVTNRGSIQDCYATGIIDGSSDVGGLVGDNQGFVAGCHSTCDVTGNRYVGGLAGMSRGGSISLSYATGLIKGGSRVGGLLGDASDTAVSRCYATGAVTGSRDVGGLIGRSSHAAVAYCYAGGSVSGDSFVGGLVGNAWSASIGWCYSTGSVTGADPVGGLIGLSTGVTNSSFFLSPEDGGGPDNGHGSALTLAQMSQESSFSGWDFYGDRMDSPWFMPADSPPVLVWQTEVTGLVAIPAITGMPWSEAESSVRNAGFVAGTVDHDYDTAVAEGHVVLVSPAGYAPVGSTVGVVLSKGAYNWQDNSDSGSPEEPYQITSPGQLESLAGNPELWDKHFILANDINLAGRRYQAALIAADSESTDGSVEVTPFTGSLDGNGMTIRYLTIEPDAPSEFGYRRSDLGLFGKIGLGGRVSNLRLADVKVSGHLAGSRFRGQMGALAAENEGIISNCSITGDIVGSDGGDKVGALVGTNRGRLDTSYAGPGIVVGDNDVGGLVGENYEGTVEDCYSVMSVSGDRHVGGLVGRNREGALRSCYAAGHVTADHEHGQGGLIGDSWPREGLVADCFWDIESTGQVRGGGGMGLTTSEMMDAGVYALNGWAGNPAWTIDDGKDYPRLAWEGKVGTGVPQPVVDWLEGSGTADIPYVIATAEELGRIAVASAILDKHFVLAADIDLEGIEWRPIGISTGTRFDGIFDGNGHTVSNLTIGTPEGLMYPGMALFGYTGEQATIKNLVLTNATVLGSASGEWISALAAGNLGKIKDCHVRASLTGSFCGGLAGQNGGLILYCTSTCSIGSDRGLRKVGGLVGENDGGSVFACRSTGSIRCGKESEYVGGAVGDNSWRSALVACSADVAVTCGNKSERVGGLVGFNWSTVVADSHASGTVTVGEECKHVGGLIGETWSDVVNCYSSGTMVTGQKIVGSGGLAGGIGTSGRVTASYFLSPVDGGGPDNGIGTVLTDQQMKQRASFGGWDFGTGAEDGTADFWSMPGDGGYPALSLFDGYQLPVIAGAGTVDDPYLIDSGEHMGFAARNPDACYRLTADLELASVVWPTAAIPLFYGDFDGDGHTIRNLTIAGGSHMGLFGSISAQASVVDLGVLDADIAGSDRSEHVAVLAALNKGAISRCAVTGTVAGEERVGGLAGDNRGQITDCCATCSVAGSGNVGGLVGENNGPVTTSYVNGEVSSPSDDWGVGAFVGYNYRGSLVNCLWERREGMAITTDMCLGLTTEQIKAGEVLGLNGWAENPSWVIDSGNDYPRLTWEATAGEPIPIPTIDWLAGAGTPEAPYEISTVEQLKLLGAASVLWDKYFVLVADLDCTGVQFERIGVCPGTGFSGHFDGTYKRVANLTLGSEMGRQRYLALFGYVNPEGSVRRLTVDNVRVSCGTLSGPVGVLAAENLGEIVNCGAAGSMDCGDTCWSIGGLVGRNEGRMDMCYADTSISAGSESRTMGGLVGSNDGHVANSYARGSIYGGSAIGNLGGLVGVSDGPIIHCYAANEITRRSGAAHPYNDMGGLVADEFSGSAIVSCYFLGWNNRLGTQLSDVQMREQASFVGWDFVGEAGNGTEDIWRIAQGQDYPRLQWEPSN